MVSHHWTSIIAAIFGAVAFLVVPILTFFALRGWAKRWRQELPRWRSALGLTSIVVTFLTWFSLAILALSERIGLNPSFISVDWVTPTVILVAAGTPLALALRGASRIEAIVAGLFMVAGLTMVVS
jgi:hypothetical protein